ncbi:putative proton-dependent oligopeptide transporter family, MFS transporter superfamily [Helianthus annuus]|nr:putative proton-dependent oligopeptide transporter family, MFS transporter superfamily [Helianthus annuus]
MPMSVFWMVPQLVVVDVGDAFLFSGQVMFYYQEFPKSIKSTAAAMVVVIIGIAFYLGTAVVNLIRKTIGWLPDGIGDGRMDNVYCVFNYTIGPKTISLPTRGVHEPIRSDRRSAHARIELQPIRSDRIKFAKPSTKVMLMLGLNLNRSDRFRSFFYQILNKSSGSFSLGFARLNYKAAFNKNKS